jgi:tetratricopeptide (TPR) repeat protein
VLCLALAALAASASVRRRPEPSTNCARCGRRAPGRRGRLDRLGNASYEGTTSQAPRRRTSRRSRSTTSSGDAHYGLGLAEFGRGDFAAALFAFNEVARLYPERFDGHFNRAVTLAPLRRPADAAEAFRRALDEAPPRRPARIAWRLDRAGGPARARRRLPGEAADAYGEALALSPDDTDLAYRRGSALVDAGRGLEALAELTEIEARTSDYRFSALIAGSTSNRARSTTRCARSNAPCARPRRRTTRRSSGVARRARRPAARPRPRRRRRRVVPRAAADVDPTSWQARYALARRLPRGGPGARRARAPPGGRRDRPDDGDVRLALASAYDQVGQAGEALVAARAALPLLTDPTRRRRRASSPVARSTSRATTPNADAEFAQVVERPAAPRRSCGPA